MAITHIVLYDHFEHARAAVEDLVEAGIDREVMTLIANDVDQVHRAQLTEHAGLDVDDDDVEAGEGAGFGAVIGGLTGLAAAAIPGIGPVLAGGALLTGAIGAAIGAATGGITAALVDLGVDEEQVHVYAEGLRRGGTLLLVDTTPETEQQVMQIVHAHNPVDIDQRGKYYRDLDDWTGFDPDAEPLDTATLLAERNRLDVMI